MYLKSWFLTIFFKYCRTKVRLGEHNRLTEIDCQSSNFCADPVQEIAIEIFIKHPEFNRIQKLNDFALVRLAAAADTSRNNINTICLPTDALNDVERSLRANPTTQNPLTITSFSKLGTGNRSDILQRALLPFVTNAECVKSYEEAPYVTIYKEYFCVGGKSKNMCIGKKIIPNFE